MADQIGQPPQGARQVGNYRLVQLLGQGSFGSVYLAEHLHLQTQAAVKLLHQQVDAHEREAFVQEARTIASLKHAHILRVLDFGFEQGMPYLVTEYAPNGTLRNRHPRGSQVPVLSILAYIRQIAQGLQYAHDRELIHRDIKPENILFDEHEQVVISDFGIALKGSRKLTEKDIAGTATYMAPELFQGKPRRASDQYALGIMVYEWFAGTPPFQGDFYGLVGQHLSSPVPPLSQAPPEVVKVVDKALEKVPEDRFPTVTAFAEALEQAIQGDQGKQDRSKRQTQQDREKVEMPVTRQSTRIPPSTGSPTSRMITTPKTSPLPRYGFWYALVCGIIAGLLAYGELLSTYASVTGFSDSLFVLLILLNMVPFCIAGFVTGKSAVARKMGWITGIAAGLSFSIPTASTPKFYPSGISVPFWGVAVNSLIVGSITFLIAVPFIFCGIWLATRNHPYYRK